MIPGISAYAGIFLAILGVRMFFSDDRSKKTILFDLIISLVLTLSVYFIFPDISVAITMLATDTSKAPSEVGPSGVSTVMGLAGGLLAIWTTLVWNATRDAAKDLRGARSEIDKKYTDLDKKFKEIDEKESSIKKAATEAINTATRANARTELLSEMIADNDDSPEYRARAEILNIFNKPDEDSIALYLSVIATNPAFLPFISRTVWQAIDTFPDLYPDNKAIAKSVQALKVAGKR